MAQAAQARPRMAQAPLSAKPLICEAGHNRHNLHTLF